MTNHPYRFMWLEPGNPEFIYVMAEQTASGWQVHTKGYGDARWRPAESNEDRINKAEELKAKALMQQYDEVDLGIAHTITNMPGDRFPHPQLTTYRLFPPTQQAKPQQPALKGWQHPTIVVISLALLISGGFAISAGWQVALIVHFVDLVALIWGRYKGLY